MSSLRERFQTLFQRTETIKEVPDARTALSLVETDNTFLIGTRAYASQLRDRDVYDRQQVLQDSLDAWRFNPLAGALWN
jgi:hypothetical protein